VTVLFYLLVAGALVVAGVLIGCAIGVLAQQDRQRLKAHRDAHDNKEMK